VKELHRVWADVRLGALRHNVSAIRGRLPLETRLMAVVKADAYGLGATQVARELFSIGVDSFGVGDSAEAIELRESQVHGLILILGTIVAGEVEPVVAGDLSVCIHSQSRIDALADEARRQGKRCRVHLKVDTGMTRLGVLPSRALDVARHIARKKELVFEGVATHLAGTSGSDEGNRHQMEIFLELRERIRAEGLGAPLFHAAASAGVFSDQAWALDMVRVGLALHGIAPGGIELSPGILRPILSLSTQVVFLKDVPENTAVGYQREFRARRAMRIATIPAGYNDCLPVSLSHCGAALIRGRRARYVGRISMDYATLDVSDIQGVEVSDRVTLLGADGGEEISLQELAALSGRIPHEFLCGIGKRVRRVYHRVEMERAAAR